MELTSDEKQDIAWFRLINPSFEPYTDAEIARAYSLWSDYKAAAGWLDVTPAYAQEFCQWAFTCPIDECARRKDGNAG